MPQGTCEQQFSGDARDVALSDGMGLESGERVYLQGAPPLRHGKARSSVTKGTWKRSPRHLWVLRVPIRVPDERRRELVAVWSCGAPEVDRVAHLTSGPNARSCLVGMSDLSIGSKLPIPERWLYAERYRTERQRIRALGTGSSTTKKNSSTTKKNAPGNCCSARD